MSYVPSHRAFARRPGFGAWSLLLLGLGLAGAERSTAQTHFGVTYAGEAYLLDATNGTFLSLGPSGAQGVNGLARTPAGELLAISEGTDELVRFDPSTGIATPLVSVPQGLTVRALAYRPADGGLYALWGQDLVRLDPATGVPVVIGSTGTFNVQGLEFDVEGRLLGYHLQLGLVSIDVSSGALVDLFPQDPGSSDLGQYLSLGSDGTLYLGRRDLHAIDPSTGAMTPVQTFFQGPDLLACEALPAPFGSVACIGQPNSTGAAAELELTGWPFVGRNGLHVRVEGLPAGEFGYVLGGQVTGFTPFPGGSQGILCLGLPLARFVDGLQSSGPTGTFAYDVDLGAIPLGGSTLAAQPGETWTFQAWYRDTNPGPTSNFSSSQVLVLR